MRVRGPASQRITASFQISGSCRWPGPRSREVFRLSLNLRVISGPPDGLLGDGPTPEGGPLSDPEQRFTGLYDQHYRRVLRYALQHADQACAEDVASETFLIPWRRLADVPEQPLPWLLGVARNLLRQQFGQATRQQRLPGHILGADHADVFVGWGGGGE